MSFCQTRNRSTQSSKVERRVAGMSDCLLEIRRAEKKLTALKLGLAFFQERTNALQAIMRMETLELGFNFTIERLHEVVIFTVKDGLLNGANRHLRPFGNFLRESRDGSLKLFRRK